MYFLLKIHKGYVKVFMPGPMVTSRSSRKLSNYLVRGKL